MKSKKHLEKQNDNEMTIPELFFEENIEIKKIYNPNSKKKARDNIKLDDSQLKKELAKRWLIHLTLLIEQWELDLILLWKATILILTMQILN